MNRLRKLLDSITMYRVVLYALSFLVVVSLVFSFFDLFSYSSPEILLLSLGLISAVCYLSNVAFSSLFGIASNFESSAITAFILYFVLGSPDEPAEWIGLALAAVIAIASKYIITWRGSHIFNPAAFGVLTVSLLGIGSGAWWIANETLLIPMLVVATIVLYKLRQFGVFLAFLIPAIALVAYNNTGESVSSSTWTALTLFPVLFLGSIMLTEPATMPNTRNMKILFGVIVGLVFGSSLDLGFISASPHLALLVGNAFAFVVAGRSGAFLKLASKTQLTPTTYGFAFEPSRAIKYHAGQYMEFTVPDRTPDDRGNRRTFTLASSPDDNLLKIGVKFYEKGSRFKQRLSSLKIGDTVMGGHVGGDFVLPKDTNTPVVFVAGGIGITPFIAMIQEVLGQEEKRKIDLYYFVSDVSEIAYKELLRKAKQSSVGVHVIAGRNKYLDTEDIQLHPDAQYYLSGPPEMVRMLKKQLHRQKIRRVHTDLFTGY